MKNETKGWERREMKNEMRGGEIEWKCCICI